jgi:hypothetical protein
VIALVENYILLSKPKIGKVEFIKESFPDDTVIIEHEGLQQLQNAQLIYYKGLINND